LLLTPILYMAAEISLPAHLLGLNTKGAERTPTDAFVCTLVGLWGGLIIGA